MKDDILQVAGVTPFKNFAAAAAGILALLHQHLKFQLWMVTRQEGGACIVLSVHDQGYGVNPGDVLCWSDSLCSRMIKGLGPKIAPNVKKVDAYATAPSSNAMTINAYIGIPLCYASGELFGTLCAIDPHPQPDLIRQDLAFIELQGKLLATLLHAELKAEATARSLERTETGAQLDFLTEIYDRRGWERLLTLEETRCQNYAVPAGVVMIDIDNLKQLNDTQGHQAGDLRLKRTAQILRRSIRTNDMVARLGGDEFGVLAIEVSSETLENLALRIEQGLQEANIPASLGWSIRDPSKTLQFALAQATQRMQIQKRDHRQQQI
ncbi:MAG: sensor domain-containing diguanylate cyclase [Cyanobacteria bacterium P01_A01_bin.123]